MRPLSGVLMAAAWCAVAWWSGSASAAERAEMCTRETLLWTGTAALGTAAPSVDTGLDVAPPAPGGWLRTVGVSADGLAADGTASAVAVVIGGTEARPGTNLPGGPVQLRHGGAVDVSVSGATVVIDRCAAVASGLPELPRTGWSAVPVAEVAAASTAIGALALRLGRARPATAGGRAPGWRRGARPHARG
jgi:hypothetical protein